MRGDSTSPDVAEERFGRSLETASRRRVLLITLGAVVASVVAAMLWVSTPDDIRAAAPPIGSPVTEQSDSSASSTAPLVSVQSAVTVARATTSTVARRRRPTTTVAPPAVPAPPTPEPSAASTTTSLPVVVNFGLGNAANSTSFLMSSTTAPSLNWSVSSDLPVEVLVTGPGLVDGAALTALRGSTRLCPGTITAVDTCSTETPGTYDYVITVSSGGSVLFSQTRALVISSGAGS